MHGSFFLFLPLTFYSLLCFSSSPCKLLLPTERLFALERQRRGRQREKSIDLKRKGKSVICQLAYMMNGGETVKPALSILLLFNLSACFLLHLFYCFMLNKGLFSSLSVREDAMLEPERRIQWGKLRTARTLG